MMLKLKLQYFGHLMRRVDSLEKTLLLGGIGGRRKKGMTEDEMAGWHPWLDGRKSQWPPRVGDGQGSLACCDSWGRKESDMTERLIWSNLIWTEAQDIKERCKNIQKNYTKKDIHKPYNHDGVIPHLKPDILECEVKWALGSITTSKASGIDGIPVELFQILKDDAVEVLHSIC